MKRFISPLRYPGGKTSFAETIKDIIVSNEFFGYSYVEPFCGGAGVALYLLFGGYADKIFINDIDIGIYSFWRAITEDTEEFIKKFESQTPSVQLWRESREIYQTYCGQGYSVELGLATYNLNRMNRSGILLGGPIGGLAQDGKYTIGCRFNKQRLIQRIEKIRGIADKIVVLNYDIVPLISKYQDMPNTFWYLDPPYYMRGPELYTNNFNHEKHVILADILNNVPFPFILSYDNHPIIRELYKKYDTTIQKFQYHLNQHKKENEIIILSPKLKYKHTN